MPKSISKEERALRGLVFGYLAKEYPRAAQLMEAQAMLDDFEAGIDAATDTEDGVAVHASVAIAEVFGKGASLRQVVHRRVAGKKKASPKSSPRMAPVAAKKPVVADSSDDEAAPRAAPSKRPASKKPTPRTSPKSSPMHAPAQARRPIPADSDSDDDKLAAPVAAAAKKPSPKSKPAAAKKPVVDDSDDDVPAKPAAKKASPKMAAAKPKAALDTDSDDEAPKKPLSRKASPKAAPAKAAKPVDSSDDEAVRPAKKLSPKSAPAKAQSDSSRPPAAGKKAPGERFCRINVEAVHFANDRLKDNRCRDDVSGFLQNQKMLQVRGKEFNKHKQKNKAKLYAAGVDQGVHSYKFSDADDE